MFAHELLDCRLQSLSRITNFAARFFSSGITNSAARLFSSGSAVY
jgi:hypothetical protein